MIVHLVEVGHGSDNMCSYVPLVGERLGTAPNAHMRIQLISWILIVLLIYVDPLLDFNLAGTVVNLECNVCGLWVYAADLADKCDLSDESTIDTKVGSLVSFFGVEELFDSYRSKRFILIGLCEIGQCGSIGSCSTVNVPYRLPGCLAVNHHRRRNRQNRHPLEHRRRVLRIDYMQLHSKLATIRVMPFEKCALTHCGGNATLSKCR